MNNKRRELLRTGIKHLEAASSILSKAYDEEYDSMCNIPENLQGSDRYSDMESVVDALEDIMSLVDEASSRIGECLI